MDNLKFTIDELDSLNLAVRCSINNLVAWEDEIRNESVFSFLSDEEIQRNEDAIREYRKDREKLEALKEKITKFLCNYRYGD